MPSTERVKREAIEIEANVDTHSLSVVIQRRQSKSRHETTDKSGGRSLNDGEGVGAVGRAWGRLDLAGLGDEADLVVLADGRKGEARAARERDELTIVGLTTCAAMSAHVTSKQ